MVSLTWINIAGGIMLILFGGRFLRKGLDRLLGAKLGGILQRLTGHPLRAFGAGLGIAVLTPSSTTVSVLAVQMLRQGYLSSRQMWR